MAWSSSDRRKDLPQNWRTIRKAVLDRDRHTCQIRDEGCTGLASEVDHSDAAIDRRDHRLEVLRAACSWCHKRRTARQGNAAKRLRNQGNFRPAESHPGILP